MTRDQHKTLVRRLFDAVNARDVDTIEQAYSPDFTNHAVAPGAPSGREGIKPTFTALFAAFPDYHVSVEDRLADGDRVAARVRRARNSPG